MSARVADQLATMVRRSPPQGCGVVAGSTPVVAFGDPTGAEIATLAINPSSDEFLSDGQLLGGDRRRLATLPSLGADTCVELTDDQVATVIADCAAYFDRNPYRRWFDPLDRVLREAVGVSYYDGTACHLDLVQWATEPKWSALQGHQQRALLADGVFHLRAQLAHAHIKVVVFNGASVQRQIRATKIARLDEVGRLRVGATSYRLYEGIGVGARWFGWSMNLQGNRASHGTRTRFTEWLREAMR